MRCIWYNDAKCWRNSSSGWRWRPCRCRCVFVYTFMRNSFYRISIIFHSMVPRNRHLTTYCIFSITTRSFTNALQDDHTHAKPESLGYLRTSVQLAERKVRDEILSNWFISDTGNSPYTECNKLLKDLQRGRTNAERVQIGFFQVYIEYLCLPFICYFGCVVT